MTTLLHGPWHGIRSLATFIGGMLLSAIVAHTVAPEFPDVARENRALENMQLALLLAASGLQLWRAERLDDGAVREQTFAVLLAFVCLALALRELDIDRPGDARIFEPLETSLLAITLAALLIYLAMRGRTLLRVFSPRKGVRDPASWFALAAVVP